MDDSQVQVKRFKAGLFVYACMFLCGVLLVQQLPALPENPVLFLTFIVGCLGVAVLTRISHQRSPAAKPYITSSMLYIILILVGFITSSLYAKQQLSLRLGENMVGVDIVVSGKVSSIPASTGEVQRFEFDVENHHLVDADAVTVSALTVDTKAADKKFPRKIRLSWYYGPAINAGESWQLQVRLKPPHGFMNPGGFDYEAWLFQHGIDATGYVHKSSINKRLKTASGSILHIRESLSRQLDAIASKYGDVNGSSFALVKALAIGEKSSISSQQWRVLANTGTSHLMAISGLHIGLASLFAYFLIRRLVPVVVIKRFPAQHVALLAGLLLAFLYALMAGFSISTQRAMIMLSVLSLMLLIRRNHRPVDALGFALFLVLLIDPLAAMSAGFWFSFSAVAVIFISLTSTQAVKDVADSDQAMIAADLSRSAFSTRVINFAHTFMRLLRQWVRLQLLISLFLLPLSLFMFQQGSLISPLVNLLLIPYVSFLVVPVVLLAIICSFVFSPVAVWLFSLAAWFLDIIWPLLWYLSDLPYALWVRGDVGVLSLLLTTAVLLLLYYSTGIVTYLLTRVRKQAGIHRVADLLLLWFLRVLLCLLLLALLFPALFITAAQRFRLAEYQLTVLDVGQGSAAVLQTQNHVLVFDAGARFSDRLDAGSGVVIPYLLTQNIKHLDRLIISHGDADHIGGAQAIIDEYPEVRVLGQDIEQLQAAHKQACIDGLKWQWDGVDFAFLSPDAAMLSNKENIRRNDRSCVLKVSSIYGDVLFTGDIEQKTEDWLLKNHPQQLSSDILVVPHHGSLTSSSQGFIKQVSPEITVISVGYKNRYRLPNKQVVARYEKLNQQPLLTSKSGAITIPVLADTDYKVEEYRQSSAKYWHHIVR
ncbi:MAG: DNA internalization-related competence protein ComEC/Rec2 [Gammaproteobacteria bacterium]|nr:DNA internalization-related competence protein ComEC/Rec2 [Gammaproteobacteria bacterium]